MNIRNTCPEIPDDWRGGVMDVCRVLGGEKPLQSSTVRRYAALGRRGGGLDWKVSKSGRKVFTGREVKRFWRECF